ncbi:tryptophan synthase subunit alpha [Streptomyces sp. VB1]|uniref:tryptophan synthase subunit alpha n=1 Tax=Streptomyces sp. VB1 TaxID=2986803 RepID=UPI0022429C52|nr:tryptophan synthase subunit alpha [Streptomyces sp. VB1]UZI33995.1 tryptophan synthase subunit alpha [Streptomyces sp. VB1]
MPLSTAPLTGPLATDPLPALSEPQEPAPRSARAASGLSPAASRLDRAFAAGRQEGRAMLAAYWPVGYPDFGQSLDALHALAEHAGILELGVPCADPVMDGPVIRAATEQSHAAGFRMRDVFLAARLLSAASPVNLLIMTYWAPVAAYGPDRFAREARDAGVAGVIVPDLPADGTAWLAAARSAGIHTVLLPQNGTDDAELARIGAAGGGMVYAPGLPGLTGSTDPLAGGLETFVRRARDLTALPVGVGIGVSSPERARAVSEYADSVIVGSALIRAFQQAPAGARTRAAACLAAEFSASLVHHR